MKVLVIQLARFGDIYQSWPTLRGLRRLNPGAQIDLLVRKSYFDATDGLDAVDRVITFSTQEILEPILSSGPISESRIHESLSRIKNFVISLQNQQYDKIINLTFSPFSSYLCFAASRGASCEIRGYSRYEDGTLKISDDPSAYFYGQVGIGRSNQFHIIDLFAEVAGVELVPEDVTASPASIDVDRKNIVLHIGASQAFKTLDSKQWREMARLILSRTDFQMTFIGSPAEASLAHEVTQGLESSRILNKVGKTHLRELFPLLRDSAVLVCGDSGPLQIATLSGCPIFNISLPGVNFHETGPRNTSDFVYRVTGPVQIPEIVTLILKYCGDGAGQRFNCSKGGFEWNLIEALYLSKPFPPLESGSLAVATELLELVHIALSQISVLEKNPEFKTHHFNIIDRALELINMLEEQSSLGPLIRWFTTELVRIEPGSFETILEETKATYIKFGQILEHISEPKNKEVTI